MPKGRRTNNRHKRKRLPDDPDLTSRGTQAGTLRSRVSPTMLTADAVVRAGVMEETATFLDKMRARFRKAPTMRLVGWGGDWAAFIGSALLLLNLTTLWKPEIQMSWTGVVIGLALVIVKGLVKIYTTPEAR